jgi:hypothetical protein
MGRSDGYFQLSPPIVKKRTAPNFGAVLIVFYDNKIGVLIVFYFT